MNIVKLIVFFIFLGVATNNASALTIIEYIDELKGSYSVSDNHFVEGITGKTATVYVGSPIYHLTSYLVEFQGIINAFPKYALSDGSEISMLNNNGGIGFPYSIYPNRPNDWPFGFGWGGTFSSSQFDWANYEISIMYRIANNNAFYFGHSINLTYLAGHSLPQNVFDAYLGFYLFDYSTIPMLDRLVSNGEVYIDKVRVGLSNEGLFFPKAFSLTNNEVGFEPIATPEPTTMLLFGLGLAGLTGIRIRCKK